MAVVVVVLVSVAVAVVLVVAAAAAGEAAFILGEEAGMEGASYCARQTIHR